MYILVWLFKPDRQHRNKIINGQNEGGLEIDRDDQLTLAWKCNDISPDEQRLLNSAEISGFTICGSRKS